MANIMEISKRLLLIGLVISTFIIICPIPTSAGPVGPDGGNWELYKPDEIFPPSVPKLRAPVSEALPATVSGTRPLLVILLQASGDTPGATHTPTFYSNLVTDPGGLNDYWTEVSYGNFNGYTPVTVAGWFASSWTRAQIAGASEGNAVIWGIQQADTTFGFDFSTVDTNGDNNITSDELTIAVITTGVGADHGGTAVWSHHTSVGPVSVDGGARTVAGIYFITAEDNPMGTWAHELGHDLLLPDLYDTQASTDADESHGIGHYGLMGSGSWCGPTHLLAFEKSQLGWLTLTEVSTPQCVNIPDVETNAVAYKAATGSPSEYFIVENRWRGTSFDNVWGWEGNLNDQGILIYHVDENTYNTKYDSNTVNGSEEHKAVDIECPDFPTSHVVDADDLDRIDVSTPPGNRGDANDLWDSSGYPFSDTSAPCSAVLYGGASSGVRILARSAPAATMQVCFFNAPPVADANGPYVAECAGATTTVSLNGAGSTDPEGDTLTYSWTTICPGGTFNDPTAASPILTMLGGVCQVICSVSLTVTDTGGLSHTDSATVKVQDTTPSNIVCPADVTIECNTPTGPSATGYATATDTCIQDLYVTPSDSTSPGACPQASTITRTWTANDGCSTSSSCAQTITVVDTTPPVLSGVPGDQTVQCDAVPPPAPVSATDNCDTSAVPGFNQTRTDGNCAANYTLTRTWTAADDCGNTAQASQVVTVQDTTPPVIECHAPPTITPKDAPVSFTATATDNCSTVSVAITSFDCVARRGKLESCVVTYDGNTITILDSGGVGDSISWIVRATDECGNTSQQSCGVRVANPGRKK